MYAKRSLFIALFITFVFAIIYFGEKRVTSTEEFKLAKQFVENSADIQKIIGHSSTIEFIEGAKAKGNNTEDSGAVYRFSVEGVSGKIDALIWVYKRSHCNGFLAKSELKTENGIVINLDEECFSSS